MPLIVTKTRFAPSPTGYLHLGNARIALFCALFARRHQGIFLLRIEDTDLQRSQAIYSDALQGDLRWLGLDWQQGPDCGGPHAPYLQSARSEVYAHYFAILSGQERAYPCFCSEQELGLARRAQLAAGQPPRYAGGCNALTVDQLSVKLQAGARPTLRFRVPCGMTVQFDDMVRGAQSFSSDDIGDFIIRRSDGTPAFFFTNALDDALMEVTHVLRGEDHLSNTPRQIMLLQSLGLRVPQYGHVPLILGHDGTPLSKRHGSHSVLELRESGYFPAAVMNYLAHLGHHYEDNTFKSLDELAAGFELDRIGRAPSRFDAAHLLHWQQQVLAMASQDEVWAWMGQSVHELVLAAQRQDFIEAIRANISLPQYALLWARILFTDDLSPDASVETVIAQAGAAFFEQAVKAIDQHQTDFKALADELKTTSALRGKALFQPLRVALTGQLDGPEMHSLLPLMGVTRARARLQKAMSCCKP